MIRSDVTMARIYLMEGRDQINAIVDILRDAENIAGVSIVRGIAGFGEDREVHTSSLVSLSLELPLIIEFYDRPEKVQKAIETLYSEFDLKHIVSWPASAYFDTPD